MSERKSDFAEGLEEMSQFAGSLVGALVMTGKKAIKRIRDLTQVDTTLKPPTAPGPDSETKRSETD